MRKVPVHRRRRDLAKASAAVSTGGVSIASGANVPRIDLEALFRDGSDAAPVTGGGAQTPRTVAVGAPETVSLTDGTRITFASADWIRVLEPA